MGRKGFPREVLPELRPEDEEDIDEEGRKRCSGWGGSGGGQGTVHADLRATLGFDLVENYSILKPLGAAM